MPCEDLSRLRIPLPEACKTPDIGCVPITGGEPDCPPQPDQIPFAWDPDTMTLWLFNCETREWLPFQKFSLCQLASVSLENIRNICNLLQIPVAYDPGTGCVQGTITLEELGKQILECTRLETNVLCVNATTLKISIEGLPNLPPRYIRGENIEFICGEGTESDPLVIRTHDPICEWPEISGEDARAKGAKIGVCVPAPGTNGGDPALMPIPKRVCEFPRSTGRVGDEGVLVAACVDGKEALVEPPKTPCEYPLLSDARARESRNLTIVACDNGMEVRIPAPSDFFEPKVDYICVPLVKQAPSGPPAKYTGPIRIGCNGEIWFWVCEEDRWERYDTNPVHDFPSWLSEKPKILDACRNVKFHGWAEQDPCDIDFEMTAEELADFLFQCVEIRTVTEIDNSTHNYYTIVYDETTNTTIKVPWGVCEYPYTDVTNTDKNDVKLAACVSGHNHLIDYPVSDQVTGRWFTEQGVGAGTCVGLNSPNGVGTFFGTTWGVQNATINPDGVNDRGKYLRITVTNPYDKPALCAVVLHGSFFGNDGSYDSAECRFMLSKSLHGIGDIPEARRTSGSNIGGIACVANGGSGFHSSVGAEICHWNEILQPNASITLYAEFWVRWKGGGLNCHIMMFPDVKLFRNFESATGAVTPVVGP